MTTAMTARRLLLALLPCTLAAAQFCGNRPFHRAPLGNATLTVVTDGPVELASSFFVTVPAAAVRRSYAASFRPMDPGLLQMNALVLDVGPRRILFDTGVFNTPAPAFGDIFRRGGLLPRNLARARVSPESVDAVVLTHAHADHVAGLVDKRGRRRFPNAMVYIGRREHEFWTTRPFPSVPSGLTAEQLEGFGSSYGPSIAPYMSAGRVTLVEDGATPLDGVTFLPTPGHTPGHMSLRVTAGGESLLVVGDAWISQPDQVQNPEWGFAPETDRDAAFASRVRLLERAARRRERVLVYHEAFPGIGHVRKVGAAFDWIPESGASFGGDFC